MLIVFGFVAIIIGTIIIIGTGCSLVVLVRASLWATAAILHPFVILALGSIYDYLGNLSFLAKKNDYIKRNTFSAMSPKGDVAFILQHIALHFLKKLKTKKQLLIILKIRKYAMTLPGDIAKKPKATALLCNKK